MELLAPGGNIEKLKTAYNYGADAVYIGIGNFSLRRKADNFHGNEYEEIAAIKSDKKLYGAVNVYFHENDIKALEESIEYLSRYPLDGFIVSDLGIVRLLQKYFPAIPLHLSTQANCINCESARIYNELGFSRIIVGRETSLDEIAAIKAKLPALEIECFVHGAMCLAYSGRCFLSRYMAGRSANEGSCTHSCRWDYRLEEQKRPGEFFPVETGEGFTSILSSKDLCMIDHLKELQTAGVDAVKIEGRMKSVYYTAIVTRAYRKHLDALAQDESGSGKTSRVSSEDLAFYREELFKVSHREFSTGFFFGKEEMDETTKKKYLQSHIFLGTVGKGIGKNRFEFEPKNKIIPGEELEFIGPDVPLLKTAKYNLRNELDETVSEVNNANKYVFETEIPLQEGYIVRRLPHEEEVAGE